MTINDIAIGVFIGMMFHTCIGGIVKYIASTIAERALASTLDDGIKKLRKMLEEVDKDGNNK